MWDLGDRNGNSSVLAWKILWAEWSLAGVSQSMGLQSQTQLSD